jgi:hypothetical protein
LRTDGAFDLDAFLDLAFAIFLLLIIA